MSKEFDAKDVTADGDNQANDEGITLTIGDDVANGIYTNFALVHFNDTEFTLDFAYIRPAQTPPKAVVRARILVSPQHIKRIVAVLQTQLERYEQQHGRVVPVAPRKVGGVFH